MILRLSVLLTNFLAEKGIVSTDDREIYIYGFEAMLSTVINAFLILIIGILSGLLIDTLIFLISFAILRVYCGGYHARTHLGCVLSFCAIYGLSMSIITFIPVQYLWLVPPGVGGFSLVFILANAPIEHKNRPFVKDEYKTFRLLSRIIALSESGIIAVISVFFGKLLKEAVIISLAMLGVTVLLALAKIINKRGEKCDVKRFCIIPRQGSCSHGTFSSLLK